MKYQPLTCVWEVTMGCNMRCGHCGSSCENALPGELTGQEALELCDQIADLGLKWITLSGGEPLTRQDIDKLVQRLSDRGVLVNIITNGLLMDQKMVNRLKGSGISTVAISIDGTREIHDEIRKEGAFDNAKKAFGLLKAAGITTGAVTTITKKNIDILPELKEELIRIGVDSWQVQLGLPMGNLGEKNPDWVLEPEQMHDIIEFCYETAKEGRIKIFPADCIGYYSNKDIETKQMSYRSDGVPLWDGCNAGVRSFGILHDGSILGCTSIRDKEYIEGNIKERPLRDIWESEDTFLWRRNMKKEQLAGSCKTCIYGSKCLGGCPNTRLTMEGSIYGENKYCDYNLALGHMRSRYQNENDVQKLFAAGDALIKNRFYQEAVFPLERLVEIDKDNLNGWVAKAYAEYMCGNYETCLSDNTRALEIDKTNTGALEGYANAKYKLGILSK